MLRNLQGWQQNCLKKKSKKEKYDYNKRNKKVDKRTKSVVEQMFSDYDKQSARKKML